MVSSGYRCPELSIAIGSSKDSQHCKGQAADFEVANVDNYDLAVWIKENLEFDQLILECYTGGNTGWVHCSYVEPSDFGQNRKGRPAKKKGLSAKQKTLPSALQKKIMKSKKKK